MGGGVGGETASESGSESSAVPGSPDVGVYVHVPFCEHVCPYCDFAVEAVGTLSPRTERDWVDALLRELELVLVRHGVSLEQRRLASVYFGGGTPSLLRPESVARVLERLWAIFPGTPDEVTLELNPGEPERARASELRAAGVTRISLGVQALDDDTLRRLGRGHGADEARAGLDVCLEAGFDSLSADLIYAAPGQPEPVLLAGLRELIARGVPHLSAYALTLEPGTPFARAHATGRLALPDEETARRMGRRVRAELATAGLAQYEISSFARQGHTARHNSRYWLRHDVLGLGPSAASLVGERRFQNSRSRAEWTAALARGELAHRDDETLDLGEQRRETLALGFRLLQGVSRRGYLRRFGVFPERDFPGELAELLELELIALRGDRWRLTERGISFADEVFLRFAGR